MLISLSRLKIISISSVMLAITSCAAPVPVDEQVSPFISRKELQVVSLAQEGLALYNSGRLFESESRLRKALYIQPELDNIRFNLAMTLEKETFFSESRQIISGLINKYPANYNYLSALARVDRQLMDFDSSVKSLEKAAKLARQSEDYKSELNLLRTLSTQFLANGDTDKAICLMQQNLQLAAERNDSSGSEIFNELIITLLSEGKNQRAERLFSDFSTTYFSDDSPLSLYLRSQIAFSGNQYSDTILITERALILPTIDAVQKFEMSVLNMLSRYALKDPKLFDIENERAIYLALNQTLAAGSLASLYWSPQLLDAAWTILADPRFLDFKEQS